MSIANSAPKELPQLDTQSNLKSTPITFRPLGAVILASAALASAQYANAAACLLSDVSPTINRTVYTSTACPNAVARVVASLASGTEGVTYSGTCCCRTARPPDPAATKHRLRQQCPARPNLAHLLLAGNVAEAHISVSAVPETATFALLGLGLAGTGFSHRKQ